MHLKWCSYERKGEVKKITALPARENSSFSERLSFFSKYCLIRGQEEVGHEGDLRQFMKGDRKINDTKNRQRVREWRRSYCSEALVSDYVHKRSYLSRKSEKVIPKM